MLTHLSYFYFNSHPHKEDDSLSSIFQENIRHFNSHPHKEDDGGTLTLGGDNNTFQLTSSQGGWLVDSLQHSQAVYFNSHPHKEDDFSASFRSSISHIFQLTSSQGGWPILFFFHSLELYFNSHPHKEDDKTDNAEDYPEEISTHILTRRMTMYHPCSCCARTISTHILTRRMTDVHGRILRLWGFQLTSSQGGWPLRSCLTMRDGHFNSHPHKEDDNQEESRKMFGVYFNSHPHKEDDLSVRECVVLQVDFNSHPHKEDDDA